MESINDIKPLLTLGTLNVCKVVGNFYIPNYQRGYRWERDQVMALLEDIYNNGQKTYWLQPVVVSKLSDNDYELVDGQQRLTTLLLIFKYMQKVGILRNGPLYSITYQTRKQSKDYIEKIYEEEVIDGQTSLYRENHKMDDVDFFFLCEAYNSIDSWLSNKEKELHGTEYPDIVEYHEQQKWDVLAELYRLFKTHVYLIWYELDASVPGVNPTATFRNLNHGHIGLTDSELVKALFLCRKQDGKYPLSESKQKEIALLWNEVEREMHNQDFWSFLTTKEGCLYPTRIELLFDFLAGKPDDTKNQHFTFEYFNTKASGRRLNGEKVSEPCNLVSIWEDIFKYYLRLKEWHRDHELYHKIGYLVTSGHLTIHQIYQDAKNLGRKELSEYLDIHIAKSIVFVNKQGGKSTFIHYYNLDYDHNYDQIQRLLLLFNVQCSFDKNQHFPFDEFQGKKGKWTLEHIHAQKSDKLNTKNKRTTWIMRHIPSVKSVGALRVSEKKRTQESIDALVKKMEDCLQSGKIDFNLIFNEVISLLTPDERDKRYVDLLSNMALLKGPDNTSISNSSFDVKRRLLIQLEKQGSYIPYGTQMVFSKQFKEDQAETQLYFWGEEDRTNYLHEIDRVLRPYLDLISPNVHIFDTEIISTNE